MGVKNESQDDFEEYDFEEESFEKFEDSYNDLLEFYSYSNENLSDSDINNSAENNNEEELDNYSSPQEVEHWGEFKPELSQLLLEMSLGEAEFSDEGDLSDLSAEQIEEMLKDSVDDNLDENADNAVESEITQNLEEALNEMQTETSGEFGGLGIEVSMEAGVVKVISPIDGSPAEEVGVKAGDYIVKINGTQVQGKTLSEAVDLMRGQVGSEIEITVRRIGKKKALIFKISSLFLDEEDRINLLFLFFKKFTYA